MNVFVYVVTLHTPNCGLPLLSRFSCVFDSLQENFVGFIRIKIPDSRVRAVSVEVGRVVDLRAIEKWFVFPPVVSPSEGCHRLIPDELIFYGEIIRLEPFLELRLSAG